MALSQCHIPMGVGRGGCGSNQAANNELPGFMSLHGEIRRAVSGFASQLQVPGMAAHLGVCCS
eukprot:scaffold56962_cov22-Tisochrysis_lutea.AAC.1